MEEKQLKTEKKGIITKCPRCKYLWKYLGSKTFNPEYPVYITCPNCLTKFKLTKENGEQKLQLI